VDVTAVKESVIKVREINPKARVLHLSSFTETGIDELTAIILNWAF